MMEDENFVILCDRASFRCGVSLDSVHSLKDHNSDEMKI